MVARTVHLTVDVHIDDDEISGHADDGGDRPRPFHGWLGLIAALNDLLGTPPAELERHDGNSERGSGGTRQGSGGR